MLRQGGITITTSHRLQPEDHPRRETGLYSKVEWVEQKQVGPFANQLPREWKQPLFTFRQDIISAVVGSDPGL